MAIGWADIQDWDPADLNTTSENLSTARSTLMTEAQEASGAKSRVQSTGTAVDAMLTTLGSLNKDLDTLVNDVSELMMATSEASNGVWDVQTKVQECNSYVEEHTNLSIDSEGSVSEEKDDDQEITTDTTTKRPWGTRGSPNSKVEGHSEEFKELQGMIQAAIDRAVEVDEAYRDRLKAVYDGTYQCDETSASESQGLPDLPQEGWSATEVSAWWNSLTEDEKKKIIAEHPEAIGNLDGIAMADRAEANKNRLPGAIEDAERELNDARERKNNSSSSLDPDQRTEVNNDVKSAEQKLKDLLALDRLVNKEGYNLLTLDASGAGEDVRAAVASGDVDNAANVVTMVPGISTTVREGMDGMLKDGENLRDKAGYDNTATVAWLGYDAPRGIPIMDKDPNPNNSHTDYMTAERAEHAAPALNGFHEGIHSWHQSQGTDPHLTTVDHSYGSLTAGTAALSTKTGVVDDMVLYGSPGGRADDVHEYNVPEGHVYASANDDDYVTGKGTGLKNKALGKGLGLAEEAAGFGEKPHNMSGIRLISSNEGGHSDYWNNPEFVEDVSQIAAGEDPSVDR
ncbi:MAG: alpha/beta hydrolase [Propionibacteriaceae bacterium]|nr:alpha/beta hydrolase [Propionibacteriaceae bacterium]